MNDKTLNQQFFINKGKKPKILLVPLEANSWTNARGLPHSLNFGYVDGLEANGVECLMIPAQLMGEKPISELSSTSWLRHIKTICAGHEFDQVWFEMVHSYLDDVFLDWIVTRVPVRLGCMYENFEISEDEYAQNPEGAERRKANVSKHLPYATHVMVIDEHEVEKVRAGTGKPTIWFPNGIASRFICDTPLPSSNAHAVFFGALYSKRQGWLDHPELENLFVRPNTSPEVATKFPELFDELQIVTQQNLGIRNDIDHHDLTQYLNALKPIREQCTSLFLSGLQAGCAVVNLPQFARVYASRVVEGMAAGRPVIAAEIPDSPRAKVLFEDGKEILLFRSDDPTQLSHHIRRIQHDPEFARRIAANAQHRLRSCYTSEILVGQVLHWLETGQVPIFEDRDRLPSLRKTVGVKTLKQHSSNHQDPPGTHQHDKLHWLSFQQVKNSTQALSEPFLQWVRDVGHVDVFIETGTFLGDTAEIASRVFSEVHTIELSDEIYQKAQKRLERYVNCHAHRGDSPIVLERILPHIKGNILFWLDGHYSGGITAKTNKNTPILDELLATEKSGLTDPFILIDDIRLFQKTSDQFISESSLDGYPTVHEVWMAIKRLGSNYQLAIIGDSALFYPKHTGIVVSSVVEGCTMSRLFDGDSLALESVLAGENAIVQASGVELEVIQQLPQAFAADEVFGLGSHYRLWYGLTLMGQGEYSQAVEQFQKAMNLGLSHWRVDWYLAKAAHEAGHSENALSALRRVLVVVPEFREAQELSAELMHGESRTHSSIFDDAKKTLNGQKVLTGHLEEICQAGKVASGGTLRLHLGCGQNHLAGYVNVDFPVSEHDVMTPKADLFIDILQIKLPEATVDEVRSHHMFEHFSRVTALALLIRWHQWLKVGGRLRIETPDFLGSAKTFCSQDSWRVKMGLIRHLAGDQSSHWGYHLDDWFPERFEHTFRKLGFESVEVRSWKWEHEPFLANVDVVGVKTQQIALSELLRRADELLWESTVSDDERPTYEVWRKQLRDIVSGRLEPTSSQLSSMGKEVEHSNSSLTLLLPNALLEKTAGIPLADIHGFNQAERDAWIQSKAKTIQAGASVLDVGAGTCPYRDFFSHCDYKTHDFKQYEGVKLGNTTQYGQIDYMSDIVALPVPDHSFDVVMCSEVLEHVPEPIKALQEMARILKPEGRLFLTAPLGSGLHQLPFHYYGGYTPEWYKHFGKQFHLHVAEIVPNGRFFKLLAQECARVAWTFDQHQHLHGEHASTIHQLFNEWLPRYLSWMDNECPNDQFTVGYHVEMIKKHDSVQPATEQVDLLEYTRRNHRNPSTFVSLAHNEFKGGNPRRAKRYVKAALALEPDHLEAKNLMEILS